MVLISHDDETKSAPAGGPGGARRKGKRGLRAAQEGGERQGVVTVVGGGVLAIAGQLTEAADRRPGVLSSSPSASMPTVLMMTLGPPPATGTAFMVSIASLRGEGLGAALGDGGSPSRGKSGVTSGGVGASPPRHGRT